MYNVTFFDQLYRLIRAQCPHCFRLRMGRVQLNAYVCKLRLLQYGLVNDAAMIDTIKTGSAAGDKDEASGGEDDPEDLIEKRTKFVRSRIREAQKSGKVDGARGGAKDPVATEARRELIREFLKETVFVKKCATCS